MDSYIVSFIQPLPTIVLFILAAITLFTLSKGADILVDEAVSLSVHWGIPKMIIGATIVSLGTTLPEATVSVLAAVNGNPDLALGNAIGSIIVDTGLIIGVAALIGKLPVESHVIKRQGRLQLVAVTLLAAVCLPFWQAGPNGAIAQPVGFLFLLLLALYLYATVKWSRADAVALELEEERSPIVVQILKLLLGVFLVIVSSKLLIPIVENLAIKVGIPQSIIAATLVAFGTSLPELVTAVTAVRKGHGELAVGNIIGADILNVLFVVGGAAAVTQTGLLVPRQFYLLQIPTMLIIVYAFRYFTISSRQNITRRDGIFLSGIYVVYLILNYTLV